MTSVKLFSSTGLRLRWSCLGSTGEFRGPSQDDNDVLPCAYRCKHVEKWPSRNGHLNLKYQKSSRPYWTYLVWARLFVDLYSSRKVWRHWLQATPSRWWCRTAHQSQREGQLLPPLWSYSSWAVGARCVMIPGVITFRAARLACRFQLVLAAPELATCPSSKGP